MRGDSGVAGEGRDVGVPKFHSWGKCTMPLTNINSDRMFNASSGLCIILGYLRGSFNPLNAKLIPLKVLCRLVPPSFTCISTSARS